ncbi:MAG: retention module-containing protein, partial [Saccharospirillum sp.]|nr:retention module-containing protein [Saccharospirillum sp.]
MDIATVISVTGSAWVLNADGEPVPLQPGMILQSGQTLITADASTVELDLGYGDPVSIGGSETLALTPDLLPNATAEAETAELAEETIARLLEALEGDGDLLDEVEATAAGGDADGLTGDGTGAAFFRAARIFFENDTVQYNYSSTLPQGSALLEQSDLLGANISGGAASGADPTDDSASPRVPTVDTITNTFDGNGDPDGTIVTGSGSSAGETIEIRDEDGKEVGRGTVNEDGSWTVITVTPLTEDKAYDVVAIDESGNTSDPTQITGDTTPPTLTVGAPDSNDTTPTISGTSDEIGATVTVVVTDANGDDQTLTAVVQSDGSWSVDVTTPLAEGNYSVDASVSDAVGNTANANDDGTIDVTAPTLTVDAPDSNDTTPTITGTSDEIGATVTVVVTDANNVEQTLTAVVQPDGTWSADVTTPLAEGDYSVDASVSDAVGNTANANDDGTIDTTAPTLTVDAPDSNDTTPTITGTSDEIGATVTVVVTDANGDDQTLTAVVQPDG